MRSVMGCGERRPYRRTPQIMVLRFPFAVARSYPGAQCVQVQGGDVDIASLV